MCGIAGIISHHKQNPQLITNMLSVIQHRGPDHTGTYKDNFVNMGMNRLSIIDIQGGNQPMISDDKNIVLIFNGEIYNFKELKSSIKQYYNFKSNSDTEVILAGYKLKGIDFFNELNGIYSIAIWDKLKEKLYLSRDPLGIKPLFYLKKNSSIYFSSEIKSFTKTYIENNANINAITQSITSGYVFHPNASILGCKQVEPGSILEIDSKMNINNIHHNSIESILSNQINKSHEKIPHLYEKTQVEFIDAINRQTMSDVPIGILLSSGIDSMTILSILNREKKMENITTYTAYYDNKNYNEIEKVNEITNLWKIKNKSIKITNEKVFENLDNFFDTYDNLEIFPVNVSKYLVTKLASEEVKVLLSGSGGDEIFLGYPTHSASNTLHKFFIPKILSKFLERLTGSIKGKNLYLSLNEKINRFAVGSQYNEEIAHFMWRFIFSHSEISKIIKSPSNLSIDDIYQDQKKIFENEYISKMDFLNKLSVVDLKTFLLDHGLMLWDKAGMANSVEVRVPFLDIKLLKFLYSINSKKRAEPLISKKFLKDSFKSYISPTISSLSKKGFRVPVIDWLNDRKINKKMMDLSLSLPQNIFKKDYIEYLWSEFNDNHRYSNCYKLWVISSIGGWSNAHSIKWNS